MDSHPLFKSYMGRIPFVKSEAWVILHRSFAKYAIDSPLARRYTAVLSNIPCPEEFYFGTVLALSEEFRDTAVYDGFRCVLWSHKKEKSSRAPEIDGGKIPTIYSVLRASGALFGRKRMKVTSPVKTFIDDEILGVSLSPAERADPNHAANKFLAKALRRVECMSQFRRKRGEYNLELRQCLNK